MITWLDEIQTHESNKIINLANLKNNNFPVPNAFIIEKEIHKEYLKEKEKLVNILTPGLSQELQKEIEENYNKLQIEDEFSNLKLEMARSQKTLPYVAIRSPNNTYLNIKTTNIIFQAIQKIYSSTETQTPILIQEMINSDKAATAIIEKENIIIKAIYGLGKPIKEITPNTYILDKNTLKIKSKEIKQQEFLYTRDDYLNKTIKTRAPEKSQTLTDEEIKNISALTKKIQEFLNKNLEIEFGIERNKIFIINLKTLKETTKTKIILNLINLLEPKENTEIFINLNQALKAHPSYHLKNYSLEEYKNEIYENLSKIQNKTLITLSNIRTDSYKDLPGAELEPQEPNPLLGWHGIRKHLEYKQLLRAEIETINKFENIKVLIPFINSIEELKQVKEITENIGIQIDTPASAELIEEFCKIGISHVLINFHNLVQLTLGIDKKNPKTKILYDEMHPAILSKINKIIQTCRDYNIPVSAKTSNSETAKFLIKQGIESIIVNPYKFEEIRELMN